MKTVGIMTLAQLRKLVKELVDNAPEQAKVTVRETNSTLVVDSIKGKLLRAVWHTKSQCHVMALEGLITKHVS